MRSKNSIKYGEKLRHLDVGDFVLMPWYHSEESKDPTPSRMLLTTFVSLEPECETFFYDSGRRILTPVRTPLTIPEIHTPDENLHYLTGPNPRGVYVDSQFSHGEVAFGLEEVTGLLRSKQGYSVYADFLEAIKREPVTI